MRKRQIILDFTSLMDIFMIILFFFIIFSHMETMQAKSDTDAAQEQAKQQSAAAQELMSDADKLSQEAQARLDRADELLAELEQADGRTGENLGAITAFGEGQMLRMTLKTVGSAWTLTVSRGGETVGTVTDTDTSLEEKVRLAGYQPEDTVLCEFIYDGSTAGSNTAYNSVTAMLTELRKSYTHFFCSEIDTAE